MDRLSYLSRAVANYEAMYPLESLALRHIKAQLRADKESIFNRSNMRGHVTASAIVLNEDGSELLLIEHPIFKRWVQPGGHVDPDGCSILATAIREVLEETGLVVDVDERLVNAAGDIEILDIDTHFIDVSPKRGEDFHYHHDLIFLTRCYNKKAVQDHELAPEQQKWLPLEEALAYSGFKTRLGRVLEKLKYL